MEPCDRPSKTHFPLQRAYDLSSTTGYDRAVEVIRQTVPRWMEDLSPAGNPRWTSPDGTVEICLDIHQSLSESEWWVMADVFGTYPNGEPTPGFHLAYAHDDEEFAWLLETAIRLVLEKREADLAEPVAQDWSAFQEQKEIESGPHPLDSLLNNPVALLNLVWLLRFRGASVYADCATVVYGEGGISFDALADLDTPWFRRIDFR